MKSPVSLEVQIDPKCHDPVIVIHTDRKTQQVEDIVHAIESITESIYPLVAGSRENEMELLSQRDIIRVYVEEEVEILRSKNLPQVGVVLDIGHGHC